MSEKITPYFKLLPNTWSYAPFLRNFDKFFDWNSDFGINKEFFKTPMDVWETDKEVVVKVAFPGVEKDEWDIQLTDDSLTIRAEKKAEELDENATYHQKSYSESSFYTSFSLPSKIDSENVSSTYKDGILKLVLPKKETTAISTKIKIS